MFHYIKIRWGTHGPLGGGGWEHPVVLRRFGKVKGFAIEIEKSLQISRILFFLSEANLFFVGGVRGSAIVTGKCGGEASLRVMGLAGKLETFLWVLHSWMLIWAAM